MSYRARCACGEPVYGGEWCQICKRHWTGSRWARTTKIAVRGHIEGCSCCTERSEDDDMLGTPAGRALRAA